MKSPLKEALMKARKDYEKKEMPVDYYKIKILEALESDYDDVYDEINIIRALSEVTRVLSDELLEDMKILDKEEYFD